MTRSFVLPVIAVAALMQVGASGGHVSFRQDVAPILTTSCSTRSCHGGSRAPELRGHDDASKMRAALLATGDDERPGARYVIPGDPDGSFLVQKIEGRMSTSECADHDCGEAMPLDNPPLSPEARQTIRAWIAQGAEDN